jgi:hypothetical protein
VGSVIDGATEALLTEQLELIEQLRSELGLTLVERTGATVFVGFIRPRDGREFMLRLRCHGWPAQLPSADFVDPRTRVDDGPQVWPNDGEQAFKTTSQPRFICFPGSLEFQNSHGPGSVNVPKLATYVHQVLMKARV